MFSEFFDLDPEERGYWYDRVEHETGQSLYDLGDRCRDFRRRLDDLWWLRQRCHRALLQAGTCTAGQEPGQMREGANDD